jgi:hypothetical protein
MDTNNAAEPLPVGAWVRVLNSRLKPGRIIEYRGPLGPGGARIYRVRFPR